MYGTYNSVIVSEDGKGLNYGKEVAAQTISSHNDSIREAHERWKREQEEKKRAETEQEQMSAVVTEPKVETVEVAQVKVVAPRLIIGTVDKPKKPKKPRSKKVRNTAEIIPSPMAKAMSEYEGRQRGIKEYETELATRLLKKGMERRLEGKSDIDFWVLDEIYNLSWELRHGCEINRDHIWENR